MLKLLIGIALGGYAAYHVQRLRYERAAETISPECAAAMRASLPQQLIGEWTRNEETDPTNLPDLQG